MDVAKQCYMWNAMKDQLISGWTNCFPTQLSASGAKRGDDECDNSNVTLMKTILPKNEFCGGEKNWRKIWPKIA